MGVQMVDRSSRQLRVARLAGAVLAVVVAGSPLSAKATTPAPGVGQFKVCLKQNMSGFVDLSSGDRATQTAWGLHAVFADLKLGSTTVRSWAAVDKDDGCFLASGSGSASYTVSIATISGALGGTNTVSSKNSSGVNVFTSAVATLGQSQTTYNVTMPSNDTARVFAALVFFIERAFRGRYSNQALTSWIGAGGGNNPCDPDGTGAVTKFCEENGAPNVSFGLETWGDADTRKFVVAHEFGHANHWFGGQSFVNDCSLNGPAHRMRGPEWASCAATEGWAHFYAADVFNWHDPGTGSQNPQAEFHYVDDGVFSLGDGNGGGCPADIPLNSSTMYPDNSPRKIYIDCFGGSSIPLIGIEMDWARHWWDYHEDTNKGGDERSHAELHDDLAAGGGWFSWTAYASMFNGLSGGLQSRWANSANWNGICVTGSSC